VSFWRLFVSAKGTTAGQSFIADVFSYLHRNLDLGDKGSSVLAFPSRYALGLGATVASFLAAVPWLVALSHQKNWVFIVSGVLIASNLLYVYVLASRLQTYGLACPPESPCACIPVSRASRATLWIFVAVYTCSAFTAYLLGRCLMGSD